MDLGGFFRRKLNCLAAPEERIAARKCPYRPRSELQEVKTELCWENTDT